VNTPRGRVTLTLVAVLCAAAALAQTAPTAPPPIIKFGPLGPYNVQQPATPTPANANGAPLFGQAWPHIGPDPAPTPGPQGRCPPGYAEPTSRVRVPHLVVCVARQPNFVVSNNGLTNSGQAAYPDTTYPPRSPAQPLSSLPPGPEHTTVNQCLGRPAGSYACGRGGTECCGPNQDNMCFAGAYACSASDSGLGTKTACCMSK
jgi:hypothetical protein